MFSVFQKDLRSNTVSMHETKFIILLEQFDLAHAHVFDNSLILPVLHYSSRSVFYICATALI